MGLPPPWTVERTPGGFRVVASNGLTACFIYAADDDSQLPGEKIDLAVAQRLATTIARLPELLRFVRLVRRGVKELWGQDVEGAGRQGVRQPATTAGQADVRRAFAAEAYDPRTLADRYGISVDHARRLVAKYGEDREKIRQAAEAVRRH